MRNRRQKRGCAGAEVRGQAKKMYFSEGEVFFLLTDPLMGDPFSIVIWTIELFEYLRMSPSPLNIFIFLFSFLHLRCILRFKKVLIPFLNSVFKLSFSLTPVFFSFLFHLLSFSPLYLLVNFYEASAPGPHFYHFFRRTPIMF